MNNDTTRIIGDFLEINADMVLQKENSKLPKFLSKIRYKSNIKKLLKRVEVFKNSNIYLTKDNILELFSYIINHKSYINGETVITVYSFDKNNVSGVIIFDSFNITIDTELYTKDMDIHVLYKAEDKNNRSYNYSVEKLDTRLGLNQLNFELKNTIADYIKSVLEAYGGKK